MMMTSRALMAAVSSVIGDRSGLAFAPAEQPAEDEDSTERDVGRPDAPLVQEDQAPERADDQHHDRGEGDEGGEQAVDDSAGGDPGRNDRAIARLSDRALDQIGGFSGPFGHSGPLPHRRATIRPGSVHAGGGSDPGSWRSVDREALASTRTVSAERLDVHELARPAEHHHGVLATPR